MLRATHQHATESIGRADALLFGRVTHQQKPILGIARGFGLVVIDDDERSRTPRQFASRSTSEE